MILAIHTVPIKVLPEVVWSTWRDVKNWPEWDTSLSSARLDGDFTVGTTGNLVMKNGQRVHFSIQECTAYESFTIAGKLFGATVNFEHDLKEIDGTVYVRHTAYLSGIFKLFFWLLMKNDFKKAVPESLNNFISVVENFGYTERVTLD